MKLLLTLNMPAGAEDFPTHQVILEVGSNTLNGAINSASENGWFFGEHLIYDRVAEKRVWKKRGPMAVNVDHVGKVAEYYEGGAR